MSARIRYQLALALIFALGLCAHLTVLQGRHREGDELIYRTLVDQLADGHGYTLQGSWLMTRHLLGEQYDRPLFHHPPAGIAFFWLCRSVFGASGFALAQLASYALWFVSIMALAHALGLQARSPSGIAAASLAALHPIMSHVLTHYWLDAPLLAVTTLAAACTLWAVRWDRGALAACAGGVLGLASWIKPTALLIAPGMFALAFAVRGALTLRRCLALTACTLAVAALVHAPWIAWRWTLLGAPWTALQGQADAGRPSSALIASNPYVRFVTAVRPAWCYLTLLPRVCWTLLPALALSLTLPRDRAAEPRSLVAPLWCWIASIVVLHVALGYLGYSKVLRYVILIAPAGVLLPAVLVSRLWPQLTAASARTRHAAVAGLAFLAAFGALELSQGVHAALALHAMLIEPWFGGVVF